MNSIYSNTGYAIYAYSDGTIWAQNNWWNGTPNIYQQNATVKTEYPISGGNPNPSVINIPAESRVAANGNIMVMTSSAEISANTNTIATSDGGSTGSDSLSLALILEYQGKSDEAIAKYQQVFNREGNTPTGRYSLRKLYDCYERVNRKMEFDNFVNKSVKTKISKNDELSALLIEFENQTLFENKNYDGMMKNLIGMLKDYKNIEPIYKQALFNLGFLSLNSLNDTSQARNYFSKLAAKYPDDPLVVNAKYWLGEDLKGVSLLKEENESGLAKNEIPTSYGLSNNFPNPFNPTTTINYQLSSTGHIALIVYDLLGREVSILVDGVKDAGYHTATFNGSKLSSGVYFVRMTALPQDGNAPFTKTMKMLMMK